MKDIRLAQLLERASDDLPTRDHAAAAWTRAVAVRRRRATVGAVAAVALVVGSAAGVVAWQQGPDGRPTPAESPTSPNSPDASGYEPPAVEPLTGDMVRDPLDAGVDYPDETRLALPTSLAPAEVAPGPGGAAVAAVQTVDGNVSFLDTARTWWAPASPLPGRLFSESLALDGGAVALRGEQSITVYSLFSNRVSDYDVDPVATTGLWANDSVGLFYDVPGPGGEVREHEAARLIDPVAFPRGEGLTDVAMDPRANALHEFVDDEYVVWSNFQDVGVERDTTALGDLRRPIAQDGVVAVVRSGLDDREPTAADGIVVIGDDLAPEALLPIEGVDAEEVVLHDFVDAHTVLIEVADRLVTWDFRTGDLKDVGTLPPGAVVSFAYDNLQWWPRAQP